MSTVTTNEPKLTEASVGLQAKRAAFFGKVMELAVQGQMLFPFTIDASKESFPDQAHLHYDTHVAARQAGAALGLNERTCVYQDGRLGLFLSGWRDGLYVTVSCIAHPVLHRPAGWEHIGTRMRRLCSCGTPTGWHESKAPAVEQLAGHINRSSAPAVSA